VTDHDPVTLDVLEANIALLADKERLERDKHRLQELDRLKTEFFARVSHDLRTPLNSIIGFAELLISDAGGKLQKKQTDFVAAIHRNGYALLGLINDLLDLASLENGHVTLRKERVPLSAIIEDARAATEPLLVTAKLEVIWPDPLAFADKTVLGDRRRLAQAVANLVDNSRKFTPEGGRITIAIDAGARRTTFEVLDTGPGIPETDRELVFVSLLRRPGGMIKKKNSGLGLGLPIVRGIAELHGGSVEIVPTPKGTHIRISIPND